MSFIYSWEGSLPPLGDIVALLVHHSCITKIGNLGIPYIIKGKHIRYSMGFKLIDIHSLILNLWVSRIGVLLVKWYYKFFHENDLHSEMMLLVQYVIHIKRESLYGYKYIETTGCVHPVYHYRYLIVLLILDIHIPSFIQPFNCFCTHQNSWEFHVTHISLTLFKTLITLSRWFARLLLFVFFCYFKVFDSESTWQTFLI